MRDVCYLEADIYIDYDADADIEFTLTHDVEVMPSFDAMGLKEDLLRGIYAYGMILFFSVL